MFDGLPEFVEVSSNVFLFPFFFFLIRRIVIDLLKGFTDCDSFIGTLFFASVGFNYWFIDRFCIRSGIWLKLKN